MLIAEKQTAGRGQARSYVVDAPGAQIAMSVGIDAADVPADAWGWLPLATGVAVVDAVGDFTGVDAG